MMSDLIEQAPVINAASVVRGTLGTFEAAGHAETVDTARVGHVRWRQEDAYTWVCTACGHKQVFLKVALLKMIVALIAERRSISTKNYRIPTIFAATWRRKREEV